MNINDVSRVRDCMVGWLTGIVLLVTLCTGCTNRNGEVRERRGDIANVTTSESNLPDMIVAELLHCPHTESPDISLNHYA